MEWIEPCWRHCDGRNQLQLELKCPALQLFGQRAAALLPWPPTGKPCEQGRGKGEGRGRPEYLLASEDERQRSAIEPRRSANSSGGVPRDASPNPAQSGAVVATRGMHAHADANRRASHLLRKKPLRFGPIVRGFSRKRLVEAQAHGALPGLHWGVQPSAPSHPTLRACPPPAHCRPPPSLCSGMHTGKST